MSIQTTAFLKNHPPSFLHFPRFLKIQTTLTSQNMQIIIESSVESGKIPEWGLLEFQGSFVTRDNVPIYNEFMGDLSYTKDGVPFFIVGHHILYGEEVKLPRPMAILNKTTDEETNTKKYLVRAVIRKKVLFKTRPKPIICQQVNKNNG